MPWEGRGTRVITPEACVTVCLAVLAVIPDKAERTRRGTSCQVAGGFEERASRGHPTPAPRKTTEAGPEALPNILPAEYALVTHRNAGVAGGAQINPFGVASMVMRTACHNAPNELGGIVRSRPGRIAITQRKSTAWGGGRKTPPCRRVWAGDCCFGCRVQAGRCAGRRLMSARSGLRR